MLDDAQWPNNWDQFTSLTRLELMIPPRSGSEMPSLLPFRIYSLIDLKVTVQYSGFHTCGEDELVSLIGSLPVLSRLQVNVDGLSSFDGSLDREEEFYREIDRLNAICIAVQSRTQGLVYTLNEMMGVKGILSRSRHAHLVFSMCS